MADESKVPAIHHSGGFYAVKTDVAANSDECLCTQKAVVSAIASQTGSVIDNAASGAVCIPESTPVNAVAAVGTITMSGIATANETFVIDTQTFTWKASRSGTGEVTIGADAAAAVTNIVTAVTADLESVAATDGEGNTVVVTAVVKGTSGNSIVFTEDSTNMAVDGTGELGGTVSGVDGTVGSANEIRCDGSYLYVAVAANTVADTNWRRIDLGSAY